MANNSTKSTNTTDPKQIIQSDVNFHWKSILKKFEEVVLKYIPRVVIAIVIILIGEIVIRVFRMIVLKTLKRSKLDQTMHKFILGLIVATLRVFLIIIVLSYLGVPTTQFVLLLTSLSLAISLALKDSLANISGGILLLATRPLKVGDYVTIDSTDGTVRAVNLVYTELVTLDNKVIFIPNNDLASGKIVNHYVEPLRRCDLQVSCAYSDDLQVVKKTIEDLVSKNRLALQLPAPIIRVADYGDSAILFDVKVWCESSDYEELIYTLNDELKSVFDERGLNMPYNTTDVNIVSVPEPKDQEQVADTI